MIDVLRRLFEERFHDAPARIEPLQGELGGSGRKIVRLASDKVSAIGILYGVREENAAFLEFSKHFHKHGLPVPEIYAEDLSHGAYLEEDFGDTTLFDFLSKNRDGEKIAPEAIEAYRKVVAVLPRFQIEAGRDLDYSVCYPRGSFDRQSIAWDLNYFKYYFLRLAGISFSEQALEDDFDSLTNFLLSADRDYFMYRDFQSRNVMLKDSEPFFLDYQGGRKGALQYDIASLLYDAKADLPPELRQQLLDLYIERLGGFTKIEREEFLRYFYAYVYVRILQALGAYGFRGFYERKAHFLQSVPYALKNLRWLLHNVKLPIALPALMEAFNSMLASEKLQGLASDADNLTGAYFEFFVSSRAAERRERKWRRVCFRWAELAESRAGRAIQGAHGKGCGGDRVSQSAGKRAPVSGQRNVAGGCEREQLSAAPLQEPDGVVRLHGRTASFGISGGAGGETAARQEWRGSDAAASRIGES